MKEILSTALISLNSLLTKDFKAFFKTIAAVTEQFTYSQIVNRMANRIKEPVKTGKKSKDPSVYIIKEIDYADSIYISMRIGNHLPTLQHFLDVNDGIPSDKAYAHNCLLLLGRDAYATLKSEKGNHQMSQSRVNAKVNTDMATFNYYSFPKDIPYHIYHLIPELMNEQDIDSIVDSANTWFDSNGDEPLMMPATLTQNVYYRNHKRSGISSIDCVMHIEKASSNEAQEVYMISGAEPVMRFDMGYVTLVSPFGEELTIHGTLDVNKCDDWSFQLLSLMQNVSSISSSQKKTKRKLTEAQQEIYSIVMKKIGRMLKEELSKL